MFPINIIGDPPETDVEIGARSLNDGEVNIWRIPEETPVAFVYNNRNYAVMLATPEDIADFAVGFSLTEEVIDKPGDISELGIAYSDRGVDLRIKISDQLLDRFDIRQRRRTMPGSASCGLCGLENADALFAPLPKVADSRRVLDPKAIEKAMMALLDHQPINARTRSVHGAAWVTLDGEITLVREDVGRHNALDKLLGALALREQEPAEGFVLMSSRCSYEIVEKAARRGIQALVAISGPTNFAIQKAKAANMSLYARSPSGAVELQY